MVTEIPHRETPLAPDYVQPQVILLTGAGAAASIGVPTLENVYDALIRELRAEDDPAARIIDAVTTETRARPATRPNFEDIIARLKSYIRIADVLRNDRVFRDELDSLPVNVRTGQFSNLWENLLTTCYRTFLRAYGPTSVRVGSSSFEATLRILETLVAVNSDALNLYTSNYDCAYHVLAARTDGVRFLTHIDDVDGHFREAWFDARPAAWNTSTPNVYIHRLHGCVAWLNDETCPFRAKEIFGAGSKLEIKDDFALHRMCIKLTASEQVPSHPAFYQAFGEFETHLKHCRALLVWGQSFRDIEIVRTIDNALKEHPFDIHYIDPYMDENDARNNIVNTLDHCAGINSGHFLPKRIPWTNVHDPSELVDVIKNTFE